ncbi:26488_t:CDS:2, partial [Racocetra persica]
GATCCGNGYCDGDNPACCDDGCMPQGATCCGDNAHYCKEDLPVCCGFICIPQ